MKKIFLILLLSFSFYAVFSQRQELKFERITDLDGLSHSNVKAIAQDYEGYMWFATNDGLNKYDGRKIEVYKKVSNDSSSLISSEIIDILEDSDRNFWVATRDGLCIYNRDKNNFESAKELENLKINDVFEDSKKNLWVVTGTNMFKYDKDKGKFILEHTNTTNDLFTFLYEGKKGTLYVGSQQNLYVFHRETKNVNLHPDIVTQDLNIVFEDSKNSFWLASKKSGLIRYDRATGNATTQYLHKPQDGNSILSNSIVAITEDANGRLWLACQNGGLSILNPETGEFTNYTNDAGDLESLSFNTINCFFRDKNNEIWLGTFSGGINFVKKFNFLLFKNNIYKENSLSNNYILSMLEDSRGNIWIGTDGGGINFFNKEKGTFKALKVDPNRPDRLKSNVVVAIEEDKEGYIWIGYWEGGLDRYDIDKDEFTHLQHQEDYPKLGWDKTCTMFIYEDRKQNLWIATLNELSLFDRKSNKFFSYEMQNGGLQNVVCDIYEDKAGNLWVGTWGGLHILDPETKKRIWYTHKTGENTSISNDKIYTIVEDSENRMWIGTADGLNLFDKSSKTFSVFRTEDGLPSNAIYGILEDKAGILWLSTGNGLCKFNPETGHTKNYNVNDGLQGNEFKQHAALKLKNGDLLFGGANGFNMFNPLNLKENPFAPPVVITDIKIFNKSVPIGTKNSPIDKHISQLQEITLSHLESVFSLEFAALNFNTPEKNQFAYKLEPFETNWNYMGSSNSATYTNLDPDAYTFRVKAANNDGVWNDDGKTLTIIITPPYWKTWWFRLLMFLIFGGGVIGFYIIRIRSIEAQKLTLKKQVEERTNELLLRKEEMEVQADFLKEMNRELADRQEEIFVEREEAERARLEADRANQAKSAFLATMSHEIRTPMNGVIGMTSLLLESPLNEEQKQYAETIRISGESLLTVINDILDFSKIESGMVELERVNFDLRQCVEEVMDLFAMKASQQGLDLIYELNHQIPGQIIGDGLRLRQVLINLVGNALKFTKQGEVYVGVDIVEQEDEEIYLSFLIRDTGIGVPEDKISRLFKAFSQVDSSTTRKYGGTGLGLIISQRLVELMGGEIKVESKEGQGTSFTFTIQCQVSKKATRLSANPMVVKRLEGIDVLVIDDNLTNLSILEKQLNIWKMVPKLASSGKEALQILERTKFDLVVSDMHMPEMDGVALANAIKDIHPELPIILLSSIGDDIPKEDRRLFSATLPKPIKPAKLFKIMQQQFVEVKDSEPEEAKEKILDTDFAKKFPLKILIAEDNLVNQKLANLVLAKLGYESAHAENGLKAIEMFKEHQFNVILMDVQMPELDGLEATKNIKLLEGKKPYIIAMTANAMKEDEEACFEAGMDHYISKPFKTEILKMGLEEAFKKLSKENNLQT